ncbi:serine hydrolase domain-containing protein [Flagellimonas flava]|uniref:D-alanyl-D-alanine carboxypeptidase n=1 Tax=Flagellimonas flava TaxID=570519 RepID=A0A1M5IMY9_9FLAO|nr:serine hydrolase domain-containing protein [Allomuricauda flava]SHG29637.1 D-alanyl-D-alanine carboxypeptidase [Allomuricauda flava]
MTCIRPTYFTHIKLGCAPLLLIAMTLMSSVFLSGCSSNEVDETPPVDQEALFAEELQTLVDEKIGTDKLLGASVSIRIDGVEEWSLQGGISSGDTPIAANMRFGIASITKTFVAATVLKLSEEGALSLDDPISLWLTLDTENIDDSITIEQLLGHFTGLHGYFRHPDIWPRVEGDLNTPIPTLELVDYVGTPFFAPGERYEYSNSNYLVLGLIIEAVTGKTVGEVFREKLFGPLQMNSIYFPANENLVGPVATPWRDSNGDGTLQNILAEFGPAYHSIFYTAADVFSTASDLSMWPQHLFNGTLLSEPTKTKMLDFQPIDDTIFTGYGLGIREVTFAGKSHWGHTGGMRGYGSYMFYDPETKVSIAMLNNQSRSQNGPLLRYQLVDELLQAVYQHIEGD